MNDVPTVTISIASFNRLPLLKEAVRSAVEQTWPQVDVLVIDDGSDADTQQWLLDEAERLPRLRVILQENQGVASARQRGLDEAAGELVCILDSDDRLAPDAVERIVQVFTAEPDTDLVYTNNRHLIADDGEEICRYPVYSSNAAMIRGTFLRPRCPFKHSGTTFRRDVALSLGGYDTTLPIKIDIDFFLRFLANGKTLRLLEEPVVEFRMHKDSISSRRWEGVRIYWRLIDRYGPGGFLARTYYKGIRAFWEIAKGAYLWVQFKR